MDRRPNTDEACLADALGEVRDRPELSAVIDGNGLLGFIAKTAAGFRALNATRQVIAIHAERRAAEAAVVDAADRARDGDAVDLFARVS